MGCICGDTYIHGTEERKDDLAETCEGDALQLLCTP